MEQQLLHLITAPLFWRPKCALTPMNLLCILDFYGVTQGATSSPYFDNMTDAFIDNCIISWISVKFKYIDMLLRLIAIDDIYSIAIC